MKYVCEKYFQNKNIYLLNTVPVNTALIYNNS